MPDFSWTNVPGYFNFQDIYDQAVAEAPADRTSVFVEVGVLFGRSLFYLAEAVKKSGKPIVIDAVDPFCKDWTRGDLKQLFDTALKATEPYPDTRCRRPVLLPSWYTEEGSPTDVLPMGILPGILEGAQQLGLDRHINFWVSRGQKVSPAKVDFVFLDAEHTYDDTLELLLHYLPRVSKGGIIAGHDFVGSEFPGVKRAVEQVIGCDYKVVGTSFVHRIKGPLDNMSKLKKTESEP